MSPRGCLDYFLGPFERDMHNKRFLRKSAFANSVPEVTVRADLLTSSVSDQRDVEAKVEFDELKGKLDQLKDREQDVEECIENACSTLQQKEKLFAEHQKALAREQQALNDICLYGKSMEQDLASLRKEISQVKEQMVSAEGKLSVSQPKPYSSRELQRGPLTLPEDYTPKISAVEALTQFHQIPEDFISRKVIEFRLYYAETGEQRKGWDSIFYKWVVKRWKQERFNELLSDNFNPEPALIKELSGEGISLQFLEQERKGFILYWQEQQAEFTPKIWQERFKQWIQRSWRRYQSNEDYSRPSYASTEELTDISRGEKYKFNFDDE